MSAEIEADVNELNVETTTETTSESSADSLDAKDASATEEKAAPVKREYKLNKVNAITLSVFHVLALVGLYYSFFGPYTWLFTWTGLVSVFALNYVFGSCGVNIGYHRLLTHMGFKCRKWVEYTFVTLGICSLQGTPSRWVATHRKHHKHSDVDDDPHSPVGHFFWGHMGWLMWDDVNEDQYDFYYKFAPDLITQKFYKRLHSSFDWLWIYLASAALIPSIGFVIAFAIWQDFTVAWQFGASMFVWAVLIRTVYVWHITWAVNSLSHVWGYQNYDTKDESTNNWFVALLTNGEGWHNNHHADPRSAAHGHRGYEIDITYLTIKALEKVGLVWDVIPVRTKFDEEK